MVDVADKWACEKLDLEVLKVLAKHPEVPAVLVLNKVSVSYDAFYDESSLQFRSLFDL